MTNIDLIDISFSYSKKEIFKNFSINFSCNENMGYVYSIMGPSGCGKSTLLKLLLSIEKQSLGRIITNPKNPTISYVPQSPILFEHLTPSQNAEYLKSLKIYKEQFNPAHYEEIKEYLGLSDILENSKTVSKISNGQQQKISLLRALSIKPDILLLDEPCNGLDADVKKNFLLSLRHIIEKNKILVVYVTHHKTEAQLISDEIIYLLQNEITKTISNYFKFEAKKFAIAPPLLEIKKAFGFPDCNILPCDIEDENININENGNYNLVFNSDQIIFSNEKGIGFSLLSSNGLYSHLNVNGISTPILSTSNNSEIGSYKYINFNSDILIYDNKNFINRIDFNNYKIINHE